MGNNEVAITVFSIIAAYTSVRDKFRKARERPKRRKVKNKDNDSEEEVHLRKSLARGPAEIENEYAAGLIHFGDRFTTGDEEAIKGLAKTLLRFNSGLVSIINGFLHPRDPQHPGLDYGALVALSDASRIETKDNLCRLRQRLAQPHICSLPVSPCTLCTRVHQGACSSNNGTQMMTLAQSKQQPARTHRATKGVRSGGVQLGLVNSSQLQSALVKNKRRPKPKAVSSSSANSNTSASNFDSQSGNLSPKSNSPRMSTPPTPTDDEVPPAYHALRADRALSSPSQRVLVPPSSAGVRQTHDAAAIPVYPSIPPPSDVTSPVVPSKLTKPRLPNSDIRPAASVSPVAVSSTSVVSPDTPLQRRRSPKVVESFYSFASDSTKLGEIPMHKWVTPFDFDTMERLNEEAESTISGSSGLSPKSESLPHRGRTRPGLLARMFKKTPLRPVAEASQ